MKGVGNDRNREDDIRKRVEDFITSEAGWRLQNNADARRVAIITAGGTAVPLEKNCVRYLMNFSGGQRGAAMAEYLLASSTMSLPSDHGLLHPKCDEKIDDASYKLSHDYKVILFTAKSAVKPFEWRLEKLLNDAKGPSQGSLLDLIHNIRRGEKPDERDQKQEKLDEILKWREKCLGTTQNRLLIIEYFSIFEYLTIIEIITKSVESVLTKGDAFHTIFISAAAVSDFYIPYHLLPEHKIQSERTSVSHEEESFNLSLQHVPKLLGVMKEHYLPSAMFVSFKLETDEKILMSKINKAVQSYNIDVVIGNLLHNYRNVVQLVVNDMDNNTYGKEALRPKLLAVNDCDDELECHIVQELITLHTQYIECR